MSAEIWTVPKDARLEWRQWGRLTVVFNPASGNTHLLNDLSARVLSSLETRASTLEELQHAYSSDLEALVAELDDLGLVVRVDF